MPNKYETDECKERIFCLQTLFVNQSYQKLKSVLIIRHSYVVSSLRRPQMVNMKSLLLGEMQGSAPAASGHNIFVNR